MTDIQREFTGQSSFMNNTSRGERHIARNLVSAILKRGGVISVNDGEEWTVRRSPESRKILEALATTGEDTLRWYDEAGNRVASFLLVWGNDDDGSELIADHTDNDEAEDVYSEVIADA